jgi:hypothetical protein
MTVAAHDEKETLEVDVLLPAHAARKSTTLFIHTRDRLIQRAGGRCWNCGATAEESGHPLEAHHYPVERCFAEAGLVDWDLVRAQCLAGDYGPYAQGFDWTGFDPARWENFVDDMTVNGRLLCKRHHIGADTGIHNMPEPLFLAQRFVKNGTPFNRLETVHRSHLDEMALTHEQAT